MGGMNGRFVGTDAAYAVGRFGPSRTTHYRASTMPDPPTRKTRAEAEQDEHEWRERNET